MRRSAAARSTLAALAGLGLLLSACSQQPEAAPAVDGLSVVTSTNVYGDIVKTIGGDKVDVTAIISKTSQDPHSYEATAQDRLAVSKADLVVENGGGYDGFIHTLAEDSNLDEAKVLNAVELSGLEEAASGEEATPDAAASEEGHAGEDHAEDEHGHGEFNEHVWYSLSAMEKIAEQVAARLGELEPESAGDFKANAETFKKELATLHTRLDSLKDSAGGAQVAVTEPVPHYLLEDAGLDNATPEDYTAAIEEGSDVPPAVLKATTDLVASKSVRILAYNQQTEGPQTQALKKAAGLAGIPVVDFSETLPEGKTYLQWMTDNVENIGKALGEN